MNTGHTSNFLLISIVPQKTKDEDVFEDLKELKELVDSFGGVVKEFIIQRREVHSKGMYIGKGKVDEVIDVIKKEKIDVVVLNAVIKPGQLHDLKMLLHPTSPDIQVWDRIDLILHIFAKHAHTAESKLQIELASMRHMGPRIYGMGMVLSSQGGGIGTRGIGETNTERMKRHWRDQMKTTKDRLDKLLLDRERQVERRRRAGLKTVSIVGYTNAGKTSLFNLLTKRKNLVNNALFVTLDSTVSKIKLPTTHEEVMLSDTIGFIQNLPTDLIDAFNSTLLESVSADLLIHVVDVSDEKFMHKINVVNHVLRVLKIEEKQQLLVLNKVDIAPIEHELAHEEYSEYTPVFTSVVKNRGIEELLLMIEKRLTSIENTPKRQE